MLRVKSPQDLGAGLLFSAIGIAGVIFGWDLPYGSAMRMGSGYFPFWLSWLITGLGVFTALRGLAVEGPPIEAPRIRPLIFICSSILIFGILIGRVGLAISVVVLTCVASYARPNVSLAEVVVYAIALSAFVVTLFIFGLGLSLPLWWK